VCRDSCLKMTLEHLQILAQQIGQLDQGLATLLHPHQDAVQRLEVVDRREHSTT
jgi:hypothetical protein